MTCCELTSRERMRRMLARSDHDRIPRHDGYWPETIERWQGEGLEGDAHTVYRLLRSDIAGVCWSWPVPFPGRREVLSDDRRTEVVRGNQGKIERYWKNKWGTPEHIEFGCDSRESWQRDYKPALLRAGLSVNRDKVGKAAADGRNESKFNCSMFVEAGFDCIRLMEAKTHMDVHEVQTKLAASMANKGYAYHFDHSVPPQGEAT
jgi:hypothetical protein